MCASLTACKSAAGDPFAGGVRLNVPRFPRAHKHRFLRNVRAGQLHLRVMRRRAIVESATQQGGDERPYGKLGVRG
jgi:hypothetical protein